VRLCKDEESVRYVISSPSSAREKSALRSERLIASPVMGMVGTLRAVVRRVPRVRMMARVGRYMVQKITRGRGRVKRMER
jgi:hypothetical protein